MTDDLKYMTAKEFRDAGYLQEVNRLFLHPLGLALALAITDEGTDIHAKIWDCRDDTEGIVFVDTDLEPHALAIEAEGARLGATRNKALGYVIQPRTTK